MEEKEVCPVKDCGIEEVKIALFGDGNGGKGIQAMVKEMHAVFTQANWAVRTVVKIFAGLGIVTGGIIGIIELAKKFK